MAFDLIARTRAFRDEVETLRFPENLIVYDPLVYAWDLHEQYLNRYARPSAPILFLGMNPGPFGMAQDGVPFGEIGAVTGFLRLFGMVGQPSRQHPKRPVLGLSCPRSEGSGRRLWGYLRDRYGTADRAADHVAVMNYCPLVFMDAGPTGKNVTPDKLPRASQEALEEICDRYLRDCLDNWFASPLLVGVGKYAEAKLAGVAPAGRKVDAIIHPSPANPRANKGWAGEVDKKFASWIASGLVEA